MKLIDGIIECLQGERFAQIMSGFDFIDAEQITVLLYRATDRGFHKSFVKITTVNYPDAGLITLNDAGKMAFTIDTIGMPPGEYDIEVRVDIVGVSAPIVKSRTHFITVKQSRT